MSLLICLLLHSDGDVFADVFLTYITTTAGHLEGGGAVRGEGDEEGNDGERGGDYRDLPVMRMHGVHGVQRHDAGQHPHGFGFYEPFWLVDLANDVAFHLVGTYEVIS